MVLTFIYHFIFFICITCSLSYAADVKIMKKETGRPAKRRKIQSNPRTLVLPQSEFFEGESSYIYRLYEGGGELQRLEIGPGNQPVILRIDDHNTFFIEFNHDCLIAFFQKYVRLFSTSEGSASYCTDEEMSENEDEEQFIPIIRQDFCADLDIDMFQDFGIPTRSYKKIISKAFPMAFYSSQNGKIEQFVENLIILLASPGTAYFTVGRSPKSKDPYAEFEKWFGKLVSVAKSRGLRVTKYMGKESYSVIIEKLK